MESVIPEPTLFTCARFSLACSLAKNARIATNSRHYKWENRRRKTKKRLLITQNYIQPYLSI
jgi:hypothetical protein